MRRGVIPPMRPGAIDFNRVDLTKGIVAFTDGGSFNNGQKKKDLPCLGGWGAVILEDGEIIEELRGNEGNSSNNRMEMRGPIEVLKYLAAKNAGRIDNRYGNVVIVSDSQYVVKGCTEWLKGWLKRGWKNNEGKPTANKELWKELVPLCNPMGVVSFKCPITVQWCWVKGYAGNHYNEMVDEIAREEVATLKEEWFMGDGTKTD